MQDLSDFLSAKHYKDLIELSSFSSLQFATNISVPSNGYIDFSEADIVLVGCGEMRGEDYRASYSDAPNAIRKAFYELYNWFPNIALADLGNVVEGATLSDTRAALKLVLHEIHAAGKIAILLGGSQDLTLQQYEVYRNEETAIDVAIIDSHVDLSREEGASASESFLLDMLTGEPNFVRHYSHIGFQSYFVNPNMLETLDKLRFDFYRLGVARQEMEEMEPVLRSCHLLSIDLNTLRACDAPFNSKASPNGFFADELCLLMRYAGMAQSLNSLGIYGYNNENDTNGQGAKAVAQMLWYFLDGYRIRKTEVKLEQKEQFITYDVPFADYETQFLKSKITNRWWMKTGANQFVPCSENDYQLATKNEIPERWMRAQERLV